MWNVVRQLSLGCVVLAFIVSASSVLAQTASPPSQTSSAPPHNNASTSPPQKVETPSAGPGGSVAQKTTIPAEERQAQLVADTNKLYQLAQELQAEVAKSTKNTLSLAVVRKAAEVEKLAKSLKERLKTE